MATILNKSKDNKTNQKTEKIGNDDENHASIDDLYDTADAISKERRDDELHNQLCSQIEKETLKHTLRNSELYIAHSIVGNNVRIAFADQEQSPYQRHEKLDKLTSCLNKAACKTGDIIEFDGLSQIIQVHLKPNSWLGDLIKMTVQLRNGDVGTSPFLP
jgi:hypothetical protein